MDKVQRLLQEREKLASWAAQAYTFAANYLSAITIDNMFEVLSQYPMLKVYNYSVWYLYSCQGWCSCSS